MDITRIEFGELDGKTIYAYVIKNSKGESVTLCEYGATVVSVIVRDKKGNLADIVLGFDDVKGYVSQKGSYFGAVVGRCANRIRGSKFTLGGKEYKLFANDGNNHLHGGLIGFDKRVWDTPIGNNSVTFSLVSDDGDEGYPGKLNVSVRYSFIESELMIEYRMTCDKDTVVNLTNHSYFNLAGHNQGRADEQELMLCADYFTPIDEEIIPKGNVEPVAGSEFDFRHSKRIDTHINSDCEQIMRAGGYDHNWVLNADDSSFFTLAAVLTHKDSGRAMKVYTTMPCVQFYSGNFLDGTMKGKDNCYYNKRSGICLETQKYPNAINCPGFPSPIIEANEEYYSYTKYCFSVIK